MRKFFLSIVGLCLGGAYAQDVEKAVSFDSKQLQQVSRYSLEVLDLQGQSTGLMTRGKVSFVEGHLGGGALDISESKGVKEVRLHLGSKFYDPSVCTIGVWLKPTAEGLGIKTKEAILLQEQGEQTYLKLVMTKDGRLALRGGILFAKNIDKVEDLISDKKKGIDSDMIDASKEYRKSNNILTERPLSNEEQLLVKKLLLEKYKTDAEAEVAKQKEDGAFRLDEFELYCNRMTDLKNWKKDEWYHVALSWNSYTGQYLVYFNGKRVLNTPAEGSMKNGLRQDSSYLTISPKRTGLQMIIDDVKVKPYLIESDINVDRF